jgi:hypothetical protein
MEAKKQKKKLSSAYESVVWSHNFKSSENESVGLTM